MEQVEPVQMNICESNTYRLRLIPKDLSCVLLNNEPRFQESLHVNYSTSPDMTTVFHVRPYGRFIEIQSKLRWKKIWIFENIWAPIFLKAVSAVQFRRERNLSVWKDHFSSRTYPSIFTSIATVLLDQSNKQVEFFEKPLSETTFRT